MSRDAADKIVLKDDAIYDQSKRAESVLDYVLRDELKAASGDAEVPTVDVETAKRATPIIDGETGRTASRILFVTSDSAVLSSGSAVQSEYLALSDHLDEVHVLVLIPRKGAGKSVRVGERVWVYSVFAPHWWQLPFRARSAAYDALVFHGSVRPDIVVGKDPYEAGLAALLIGRAFERPVQVHVPDDFTEAAFRERAAGNKWRKRIAKYVLKRVPSVRARTDAIKGMLQKRFKNIADLEVLPRFFNFSGFLAATPSIDVHDTYRDYIFIAVAFGPLTADSYIHDVFTALNRPLHNPRIGLIVVGEGPAEHLFQEKVKLLGIERNVVFLKSAPDPISLLKTADLLVEAGTTRASEANVMRAAAAGLPVLAIETEVRKDLFEDGHSAFLCPAKDIPCITQKFTKFLNTPALRKQFSLNGTQIARDRLIEDPNAYYRAYRDSIEVVLEGAMPSVEAKKEPAHTTFMPASVGG